MKERSFVVVALCFFLSGLAALMYETAWTKEFAFVFGTSELAVATVLAAYMAGLAAGAAVGGRIAARTGRPLALYGALEFGIGIAALLVPLAISLSTKLLVALFGGQPGFEHSSPLGIALFYLLATFAIIMVPTMFMGATLPLLSRHVVTNESEIGTRIGALYAINTGGAVVGTLTAAFVLLPALGIRQTVYVAAAINVLVFLIAIYLVRIAHLERTGAASHGPLVAGRSGFHLILPLMTLSGALSFTYEVLWVRLLSQLLGGSIYAFATMLASFLAGIAIGSAISSRLADSVTRSQHAFVLCQLGVAVFTVLGFAVIDYAPALTLALELRDPMLLDVGFAIAVLLPAAVCIGATFPFAVRIVARDADDAGPASARVYTWNTVGAIIGSIGAAFVLLPELGFRGTIVLGISLNVLIAIVVGWHAGTRGPRLAVPILVGALLFAFLPGEPWSVLRASPINRSNPPKKGPLGFYEVGRGATVLLTRQAPAGWRMSTNGLPESMINEPEAAPDGLKPSDLLGALGPLLRPDARSMLVVGLGGGVTVEDIPRHVDRIDVIELEREVIEANRWLSSIRARDPFADPRVHIHEGDARGSMQLTDQRFDVIAAQASHPWTGGASHLYTSEFFELVENRLEPGGIFVQWLGKHFTNTDLLKSVVATLYEHFEYVHVYTGFLFAASNEPIPLAPDLERLREFDPDISERTGVYEREDFVVHLRLDDQASRAYAATGEITTDDRNLLQMRSPLLLHPDAEEYEARETDIAIHLREHDPLPRLVKAGELDVRKLIPALGVSRIGRRIGDVIDSLEDPDEREVQRLLVKSDRPPVNQLLHYLQRLPDHERLRASLLLQTVRQGRDLAVDIEWTPEEIAVRDATRLAKSEGVGSIASFDADLARVAPTHSLYIVAASMRASWRIETGDPERLREAIEIVDACFNAKKPVSLLWLRAQAGAGLGDPTLALASLSLVQNPIKLTRSPKVHREIQQLLEELDVEGQEAAWRDEMLNKRFGSSPAPARGAMIPPQP